MVSSVPETNVSSVPETNHTQSINIAHSPPAPAKQAAAGERRTRCGAHSDQTSLVGRQGTTARGRSKSKASASDGGVAICNLSRTLRWCPASHVDGLLCSRDERLLCSRDEPDPKYQTGTLT